MKQRKIAAQAKQGAVTTPSVETSAARSTLDLLQGRPGKGRKPLVGYAQLREWPELAPAVAIHHNLGKAGQQFRVPVKLMRKCGMRPDLGVHVAVQCDRVLLWGDDTGGEYRQDPESKQFILSRAGVGPRLTQANFAIVEGPDYLIITTQRQAAKLAGAVPVHAHSRWERLSNDKGIERHDGPMPSEDFEIRGWQDVKPFHANCRAKTGIAQVCGNIWYMAGFVGGDPVRFTRYADATVIEKCAPGEQHSVLSEAKPGRPRHFIGATLFDLHLIDRIRVVATPGRLIVTRLDSDLGRRCEQPVDKKSVKKQAPLQVLPPTIVPNVLAAEGLTVVALKDYDSPNTNLNVYGRIWHAAGIDRLQPARVVKYANALVVERCSEAEMEFRIGSPSQALPYRCVSLVGTLLAGASKVRVLATPGRVVLTTRNSDIGRKFRNAPEWPSKPDDVAPFLAALGHGHAPAPVEEEAPLQAEQTPVSARADQESDAAVVQQDDAVDVARYAFPTGKRLQIQGRWLSQYGFTAGAKFGVVANGDSVHLELGGAETCSVTEMRPGTSKLYVPAANLEMLGAKELQVRARPGRLELVAA